VCSRREAVRWIEAGRVQLDGKVVTTPEKRVDLRWARIDVDGRRVREEDKKRLVGILNKPEGYITTRSDEAGRPTIYDLLGDLGEWAFPVGRLDRDTSGMLVVTNDNQLGNRLTDPEQHVPKTYHAQVRGLPGSDVLQVLREGVLLDDGSMTLPARVRSLGAARSGSSWIEITLTEGKNRQVRRMCAAVGHDVEELVRVRIGTLDLGDLAPGEWRRLTDDEIKRLEERTW
jgi:23S rRNA pseudouridine2605 synthase